MATMAESVIAAGSETRPPMLEKGIDIKAVNILLLEFPVDIYTLINHYQTAKEIWDRVKELMECTEITKLERASMLYDEFDKFTSEPGESIHSYYLRYVKLINDMKMIPMSMSNMQINTNYMLSSNTMKKILKKFEKCDNDFRNHLLCWQIPTTHVPHTALITSTLELCTYSCSTTTNISTDTGFVAPTFLSINDPIASLNKAMIFLSFAYNSRYPPTNNQLRTSSNPRTQATIQNGRDTIQNVQGRQSQGYAGNARKNQASGARVVNRVGNAGQINQDSEWFKDKMLIAQAQEAGVVLNDEQQEFLADSLEEANDYCDDKATTNAIFMVNLSLVGSINADMVEPHYDSNILSKVPHYDTYHDSDMLNFNIQEMGYIENIVSNNESFDELTSNNNVISYTNYMLTIGNDEDNYVPPPVQKNDTMLFAIE
ncbi:hypothetical protein Tco_0918998 [Tanacetum coccineum]